MTCARCGADLPEGALFCGECGNAVYASGLAPESVPPREDLDENPTRVVDLLEQAGTWHAAPPVPEPQYRGPVDPTENAFRPAETESVLVQSSAAQSSEAENADRVEAVTTVDEATRFPERAKPQAAAFTLHFSTGESVTVEGTGLIGRRPAPQPGEFFDGYVTIDDPGRSVSKTHLEFGHEGGAFWISDRFSANGTMVREPGKAPRLCPAGMRSRVPRGSRVDIGEQFFVVT